MGTITRFLLYLIIFKSFVLGWQYRYYCPIPGCIHHILKCLEEDENDSRKSHRLKDDNKNGSNDTNDLKQKIKSRHFINITSLKQHYSKVIVIFLIIC